MSTETPTDKLGDALDKLEATVKQAEAEAHDEAEIRADVEAVDPGPLARDEDERLLYRYLRRRAQLTAELTLLNDQFGAMVRDVENRLKTLDWLFLPSAERIARAKLHGARARSLKTPFGTVGFRKVGGGVIVVDEAKLIAHATATPGMEECVRRPAAPPPEVAKKELNEWFKQSGEVPPGCDVSPKTDKFYVD